ncbi:MAG: hypothetical protein ACFFBP_16590 [Promethearchaeota archaeon]
MIFQTNFLGSFLFIEMLFFIPITLLSNFFTYKVIKTRRPIFGYLAAMNICYLLSIFLVLFQFIASDPLRAEWYFIFSEISKILLILFLLLTFEIFYRNTQYSKRQTITIILVFTIIGGLIAKPEIELEIISERFNVMRLPVLSPTSILKLFFSAIVTVFLIFILIKSRKSAWNSKQKKYISWLLIGSLIGVLIPSLLNFIWDLFIDPSFVLGQTIIISSQLFQFIPQTIGILIIGLIFFKISKNLWLLQNQKVYLLIVYSHSGLTLYSKSFMEDITPQDTQLLAGAFSAISSLIKDGTKTSGEVKAILLEGKLLKVINRENFICALLVEYSTQATEEAHEKFTLEFERKFNDNLKHFDGEVTQFTSADNISNKYFT